VLVWELGWCRLIVVRIVKVMTRLTTFGFRSTEGNHGSDFSDMRCVSTRPSLIPFFVSLTCFQRVEKLNTNDNYTNALPPVWRS